MQNAQHSALSPQHLNGWVSKFFVQYNGRKLGPYYARCWKENNKQKREYIKPADLERVRAACQRYRDHRKAITNTTRDFYTLTGNLNYVQRMARRLTKGFLRPEDYNFIEKIKDNGFHTPGRPKMRSGPPSPFCRCSCGKGPLPVPGEHAVAVGVEFEGSRGWGMGDSTIQANKQPNTQDLKRSFMYPLILKVSDCHPACPASIGERADVCAATRDLTVTTSCPSLATRAQQTGSRRELRRLRARLLKPMQDKLAAETPVEKLIRWNQEIKARPRPRPNIERALPNWITKEQIAADVQRVREAFSNRK